MLPAIDRLDEIPGIGRDAAQVIIAEIGLDMSRFPTAGHLVSWAKLSPRTIQSGARSRCRQDRQGQPLPQGRARRGRRRGRQDRHLPRRTLPADRQAPRQAQGPGRRRPLHPGHRLAPARRPQPPATATSAPATTPAASTKTARPATTSASSKPSATPSPSPRPPDQPPAHPAPLRSAGCCRAPR